MFRAWGAHLCTVCPVTGMAVPPRNRPHWWAVSFQGAQHGSAQRKCAVGAVATPQSPLAGRRQGPHSRPSVAREAVYHDSRPFP